MMEVLVEIVVMVLVKGVGMTQEQSQVMLVPLILNQLRKKFLLVKAKSLLKQIK
jgi:hypothetical protein